MNNRVNAFADLAEATVFTTKQKPWKPVAEETIAAIAEDNNFPSRQATKPAKAKRRNQQFNAKATQETIARIYKNANERKVPRGK